MNPQSEITSNSLGDSQERDSNQDSKGCTSKRAAQNRAAQRAFRQRKEQHVKDLEKKAQQYEILTAENEILLVENEQLRHLVGRVQSGASLSELTIPKKAELASFLNNINLESSPSSHEVHKPSNSANETRPAMILQQVTATLSNNEAREPGDWEGEPFRLKYQNTDSNVLRRSTSHSSHASMANHSGFDSGDLKSKSTPMFVESDTINDQKSDSGTLQGFSNVILDKTGSLFNLQGATSESNDPSRVTGLNEHNLAFLQYGWIYDPALVQNDYHSSYCEITGTTPGEASFNDRVMGDLYSLLELGSSNHEESPLPETVGFLCYFCFVSLPQLFIFCSSFSMFIRVAQAIDLSAST
ncbi:hypothetical protein K493DRAFT_301903 [Basidiobolus meristosporus CBS 931.73]|uniref:BZIP domain-containing protein n=1 Tax=Basidiobolus meristosporus CBS 931.73 TaxID=1314790 RepID=A0A1Y1Y9M2_9FUNG|nr:hypothetical protein K493DRAFT_301903 [Basidiobolus meristosporus CBS 931.73]|eukprot:ORX94688.1 hypothetical protein K493DRAFT_301903 [Basidiobolus meristosporus CBS 931.73]